MRLSYRHCGYLREFLSGDGIVRGYSSMGKGHSILNGSRWRIKYINLGGKDEVPVFARRLPNSMAQEGIILTFDDPRTSPPYNVVRNSSPSLLAAMLTSAGGFMDKARTPYYSSPGFVFDTNLVPLMWVTKPAAAINASLDHENFRRTLHIHPYVFRKADSVSRLIADTILPVFLDTEYKKDASTPLYDNYYLELMVKKTKIDIGEPDKDMFVRCTDIDIDTEQIARITNLYVGDYEN